MSLNTLVVLTLLFVCKTIAAEENGDVPLVVFSEAGAVDDYACTVLLAEMHKKGQIKLLVDIVQNGDSVLPASMQVAEKFHELTGITDVPLTLSQVNMYNGFPWLYRGDSKHITELQAYQDIPCDTCKNVSNAMDYANAEDFLLDLLEKADEGSITYLCTASFTNLAAVLRKKPELESKIKEILWMGGAVNVPGNMEAQNLTYNIFNDKAEWNVFTAPFDAAYVFANTSIPIKQFPLDIANQVPVKGLFIETLGELTANASDPDPTNELLYAMYDEIAMPQPMYRLWNTVAAAYLSESMQQYYEAPEDFELTVVTDFENQGWTAKKGDVDADDFRPVKVFLNFKSEKDKDEWTVRVANADV